MGGGGHATCRVRNAGVYLTGNSQITFFKNSTAATPILVEAVGDLPVN